MIAVRGRKGQAAVEMALILPVLLLLVLGIVEFGRAWNLKHVVTDATREAARHAVVQNPMVDADSVRGVVSGALARAGFTGNAMTMTFDDASPPAGHWRETGSMQAVEVGVQYRFGFLGPVLKATMGKDAITVQSRVTMRNE